MADLTAQRTLVKSPPELWSELSEVESLAKHLGELGEIRITKVEPESTVAWEGEQVSGTVELEQSGWGTKVTFKATVPEPEAVALQPDPEPPPETIAEPGGSATPPTAVERGFFARWLFRQRRPAKPEPAPGPPKPEPDPELVVEAPPTTAVDLDDVQQILDCTLNALGQAHHRPFSRG